MRALAIGAGVLVLLVAGVLLYAGTRPDTFRVQRSAAIQAPPEKVFAHLNDFQRWPAWSPWERRDPAMKRTLSTPSAGKGATYAWEGNKDVGSGRMEIVDEQAPKKLGIRLDFLAPFEAHNAVDFTLEARGAETHITWAMYGEATFLTKLIGVFMSMDSMVGKDFEAGLANLKAVAEKP